MRSTCSTKTASSRAGTPARSRFKGYEAAEIIGQHFSRFYTEEDRAAGLPHARSRLHEAGSASRAKVGASARTEAAFWVHVVIDPIRDTNGRLIGYAKITRDLTEQKSAQRQRCARAKSSSGFWSKASPTTRSTCSLRRDRHELEFRCRTHQGLYAARGHRPALLASSIPPEDAAAGVPQIALGHGRAEGRFEKEGWRYRKDGTRSGPASSSTPSATPGGELIGFAKITRDITERRQAQEQLEQRPRGDGSIAKNGRHRSAHRRSRHDFNNLLMAVLGSLELFRKRLPEDPKLKSLLDNAFEGARRGVGLSQRMLAFARRQELSLTRDRRQGAGLGNVRNARAISGPPDEYRDRLSAWAAQHQGGCQSTRDWRSSI